MKNNFTLMLRFIIIILIVFSTSRCTSPKDEVKDTVMKNIRSDNELSKEEWEDLVKYVEEHKEDLPDLIANNKVDVAKLNMFIMSSLPRVREGGTAPVIYSGTSNYSISISKSNNQVRINFFLENSMSMDGYVTGTTNFEAAVSDFLVLLGSNYSNENIHPNFINDQVYSLDKNLREMSISDLIKEIEPNSSTYTVGNRTQSKLNHILEMVLAQTGSNNVSVLISDYIYSLDSRKYNTEGALNFEKSLTKAAFITKINNEAISTAIIKLESNFTGVYYDKNNTKINLDNVLRPYYICLFGKPELIDNLLKNIDVNKLEGFRNKYVLKPYTETNDLFFTVLRVKNKLGSFRPSKENSNYVHSIEEVEFEDGRFRFSIAVNFKNIPVDLGYLENTNNYKVTGDFIIEKVERIDRRLFTDREKGDERTVEANKCTHLITLSASHNFASQKVIIELKDQIPQWVYDTHTENDVNPDLVKNSKTFGLKYLIEGISEAYQEHNRRQGFVNEPQHTKISISISK